MVDLLNVFRRRGDEVTFYTTGIFGNYPDWQRLEMHCYKIPAIRLLGETIVHPRIFLKVFLNKPDFLIVLNTEGLPSLLLYVTAKLRGIPTLQPSARDRLRSETNA